MTKPEAVEAALRRAAALLAGAPRIAVACHVGPDGDAVGSLLGLAIAARNAGKEVAASYGRPFGLADVYRFLPVDLLVPPERFPSQPELMVSLDAASLDRLGELAAAAGRAGELIVVDHHASNAGFGTVDLIDPGAAATAQLVHDLVLEAGWPVDAEVATCLYVGLVSDTGRFQYSNTTPGVLRLAAALVEAGARPEVVGRHLYGEAPFAYLTLEGDVLTRAVLEPDRRLVWSVLWQEDLETHGIGIEETDSLIDALRLAREAEVAALVKEQPDGSLKVSLRSRGEVNVGVVAAELGGGGHHNAAGFSHAGPLEVAIDQVRTRLSSV